MEPGRQRENPPGSGDAEAGEWREETGVEAADRDETLKNRSGDGGNEATKKEKEEYDEEQYEEELDPRIQVLQSGLKMIMTIWQVR